jgi:hypothetical protein
MMSSGTISEFPVATRTMRRDGGMAATLKIVVPFVCFTLAALVIKPGALRLLFPALVCLAGYFIYKRNECHYMSFMLWIVMLTPLLRRLVDYKTTFQMQSALLIAPLVVTLLPLIDLRRRLALTPAMIRVATLLTLGGVIFGLGIGLIKNPSTTVVLSTVMWIGPMVLCIFTASIQDREKLAKVLTSTFAWGVVVMSIYGVYQFIVAPPWDTYWLKQIDIANISPSFGHPEPYGIRIWSTMNSPGSFALFLGAALIWLATRDGIAVNLANILGYVALCLSLVRTAWMMTVFGLILCVVMRRKTPSPKSIVVGVLTLGMIGGGLLYAAKFPRVQDRLRTFTSLKEDESVQARKAMYRFMEGYIVSTPLGEGLQSPAEYHGYLLDSTFAELFFMLGWIGTFFYAAGLGYLMLRIVVSVPKVSGVAAGSTAIVLAMATQSISGDILYRQGGVILWLFIGVWAPYCASRAAYRPRYAAPWQTNGPAIASSAR